MMSHDDEKIEFTTRGVKQLRNLVQSELKPLIDTVVKETLDRVITNRVNIMLDGIRGQIMDAVERRLKEMYWAIMKDALHAADFQELFKNEIVAHLHNRWASGRTNFDDEFDKAVIKALKSIIGGRS